MNRLEELYETTLQLHQVLHHDNSNRDEKITSINDMLDKREEQLKEIVPPYTDEEKIIGQKLLPLNADIQKKLDVLFNQVKTEMKTVRKQKSSNNKYTNPYQNLSNFDGMFLDHKK